MKQWQIPAILSAVALVTIQFTNCSGYEVSQTDDLSFASVDCDEDCIVPVTANLSIKANLGGASTEYSVPPGLLEWNIGGDCNEGGYPYNLIRWELRLNGVLVRHSGMAGLSTSGGPADSVCVNGRYRLAVNLKSIPSDPVNRAGLLTGSGSARGAYDLYIEIFGKDTAADPAPKNNPSKGKTRISLLPI